MTRDMILAIDPGSEQSSWVVWDGSRLIDCGTWENEQVLSFVENFMHTVIVEEIESYGMPVGKDVFRTVFWCGRFKQACNDAFIQMPRRTVKLNICRDSRAKDSNIRQALIDRFGDKPTKVKPNPVYRGNKPKGGEWQAWALAVTWGDLNKGT